MAGSVTKWGATVPGRWIESRFLGLISDGIQAIGRGGVGGGDGGVCDPLRRA